jgi:Uma2 family endonuclease
MPIISTTKMTAQQFLQLGEDPPGMRLELVDGDVAVSPSPTLDHSNAVVQLIALLSNHLDAKDLGELHHDVAKILNRSNVRRPDLLFFFAARTHLIGKKAMEGPPDLAIEVISPSSVEIDREDKSVQYRESGVTHYWIIDPSHQTIDAWRLDNGTYLSSGHGQGTDIVKLQPFPDLEIPLTRLWRRQK